MERKKKTLSEAINSLRIKKDPYAKIIPLNQASYRGRANEYRGKSGEGPNYLGPMRGAGSGTRDRMPGVSDPNIKQLRPRKRRNGGDVI